MSIIRAFMTLALACCACTPIPMPPGPGPIPPSDGACQAAQERLEELGCPEAKTPAGTPFGEACEAAWADGRNWCAGAVAKITKCSQVEAAAAGERGDC